MSTCDITIVVPCYNEEEALGHLYDTLTQVRKEMHPLHFEFLFVDDGSRDNTLKMVKELAEEDDRIRYLSFSRNFGKEAAMFAGLSHAKGAYICIMDADLQDQPELLPQLYKAVTEEGYDCAAVRRVSREGEPVIRSFFARKFYRIMGKLCSFEVVDGARDYRLMTRQMVDAILELQEKNRYSKGLFSWVGFKTKWIECVNRERVAGQTKWSFWDLLFYAIDAMVSFSTAPLMVSSILGLILCFVAFFFIVFTIVRQLVWGGSAYGWPSLVCIILFVSGIQLFCIGILGQYLAKTFTEIKNRPIYIIKEEGGNVVG